MACLKESKFISEQPFLVGKKITSRNLVFKEVHVRFTTAHC